MSLRKLMLSICLLIGTFLFAACGSPPTQAAPTSTSEPLDYVEMPLSPEEIIHISGETSVISKPLTLEGPGALKVYWRQDCDDFFLQMVNTNKTLAEAPLGTLIFEGILGPSEYVEDKPWAVPFEYVPGEYVFTIDAKGECSWEVWAKVVFPEGE